MIKVLIFDPFGSLKLASLKFVNMGFRCLSVGMLRFFWV